MSTMEKESLRFVFFGTPQFATIVLDELEKKGFVPTLVVTTPDKPRGRKLVVTPTPASLWAQKRSIPVLTPEKLLEKDFLAELKRMNCDLFIVAAYGKIIPKMVLDVAKKGALNVHPSLLPKFRGPSPIESTILSNDDKTGVTIIRLDEETDHGPILAQREFPVADWPPKGSELTEQLAHFGGALLAEVIPDWMGGLIPHPQDHSKATYCTKITKEDGLIDLSGDPLLNYKKIRAFDQWPGAHYFAEHHGKMIRVRISDAQYENGELTILRVIPAGKNEMSYEDFLRGQR